MSKNKQEVSEQPKKVQATLATPALLSGTTALSTASPEILEAIAEVKDNLESVENFVLPRVKASSNGLEIVEGEPLVMEIEGVILHTKKQNIYYANPYNPNEVVPPDCFSMDGNHPDSSIKFPQNPTCKGCPQAEFGTNSMKSGKACRNLKPLYMIMNEGSIMPRQFTVSPSSLKAANTYLMNLTERGLSYRKVRTKIEAYKENPKDTYVKIRFKLLDKLNAQEAANIEFLKAQWLPIMDAQVIDQREVESTVDNQTESNVRSDIEL